jgi:hypothetical protein
MKKVSSILVGIFFVLSFISMLAASRVAIAQDHVVATSDLQRDVAASTATRQKNQAQVEKFISSPEAQRALKSAHLDAGQVKNALPQLSDEEMAELSARSQRAQTDFAAGNISDRDLLVILVAIAALILIIVAVR